MTHTICASVCTVTLVENHGAETRVQESDANWMDGRGPSLLLACSAACHCCLCSACTRSFLLKRWLVTSSTTYLFILLLFEAGHLLGTRDLPASALYQKLRPRMLSAAGNYLTLSMGYHGEPSIFLSVCLGPHLLALVLLRCERIQAVNLSNGWNYRDRQEEARKPCMQGRR